MSLLIATLIKVDPEDRPNINQILKFPLISEQIPAFLDEDTFKDEFSHTIIHNKMYFEKPDKKEDTKEEEEAKLPSVPEEDPKLSSTASEDGTPEEYYKKYVKYINKVITHEDDTYADAKAFPSKKNIPKDYDRDD